MAGVIKITSSKYKCFFKETKNQKQSWLPSFIFIYFLNFKSQKMLIPWKNYTKHMECSIKKMFFWTFCVFSKSHMLEKSTLHILLIPLFLAENPFAGVCLRRFWLLATSFKMSQNLSDLLILLHVYIHTYIHIYIWSVSILLFWVFLFFTLFFFSFLSPALLFPHHSLLLYFPLTLL